MLHHRQNQCIVISGESGAGKTESANHLLRQLVNLGQAPNRNLEQKILAMNPVMEAFGNARTGINDNSSRFGKFLDVTFNWTGRVAGARVSVYLLEQSRVAHQARMEQNFHIFYYLYDSLEAEGRLEEFHLSRDKRTHHRYLNNNIANNKTAEKNVKAMTAIRESLSMLGFRADQLDSVFRILAAIIHLGDVSFTSSNDDESNTEMVVLQAKDKLRDAAELLGVTSDDLREVLTTNSVVTRGESILRNNTHEEAITTRDAMAKALYGRLFDWIVNQMNRLLAFSRAVYGESLAVGLLDIFGFENLENNSFEQLCINIANEQLQYYFNQHIFSWEQQEYVSEGIGVELVGFTDNRPLLDLFLTKPLGMLALLDEESRFPGATDRTLVEKFHNNIKSRLYIPPKGDAMSFEIRHFAGKVQYSCADMLSKNRNFLPPEVIQVFRQSSSEVVRTLFQSPLTKTGNLFTESVAPGPHGITRSPPCSGASSPGSDLDTAFTSDDLSKFYTVNQSFGLASQTKAQQTVATYFRYSLMDLLQNMVNGAPHFVRCIKPNDTNKPNSLNRDKVRRQLRYAGVLETVRIRQQGFSHRIPFAEFLRRYCFLAFNFEERVTATADCCRLLLLRLSMDGWAVGRTKVFLKYYHVEYLAKLYDKQIAKVIKVQAMVRRWLVQIRQKESWRVTQSVIVLQRCVRKWLDRRRTRRRTARISSVVVGELTRQESIDAVDDDLSGDLGGMTEEQAATTIQRVFRGHRIRKKWGPALEARIKATLRESTTPAEAQRRLTMVGLTPTEAALIIQKCWKKSRLLKKQASKDELSPHERKKELRSFAEQVHQSISAVHMRLRESREAVHSPSPPPDDYKRPAGFDLVPKLIREAETARVEASKKREASKSPTQPPLKVVTVTDDRPAGSTGRKMANLPEWDQPLRQYEAQHKLESLPGVEVDLREARLAAISGGLKTQDRDNADRRESLVAEFQAAVRRSSTPGGGNASPKKVLRPPVLPDAWQAEQEKMRREAEQAALAAQQRSDTPRPSSATPRPSPVTPRPPSATPRPPSAAAPAPAPRSVIGRGAETSEQPPGGDLGPFNFRQLLRPAGHAPTESLRLRKGWQRPEVNRYGAEYDM